MLNRFKIWFCYHTVMASKLKDETTTECLIHTVACCSVAHKTFILRPEKQTVTYDATYTGYTLDSSVPQGSVLGPIKLLNLSLTLRILLNCFTVMNYIITSMPMTNKSMIMSVSVRLMFPYSACMTVFLRSATGVHPVGCS